MTAMAIEDTLALSYTYQKHFIGEEGNGFQLKICNDDQIINLTGDSHEKNTARVVYGAYHVSPHYISLCRHKESLCVYYSGYKSCGNDTSTVVISDNMVYSNDEYIGSVSVSGNTVFFNYSEDYLKSSIEESLQDSGYDAEVQSANVTYRGLLSGNKINNGKIRGNVKCLIQGYTINIKYKGTFKARRKE